MALLTDAQVTKRSAKPTYVLRINNQPILPANPNDEDVPGVESWKTEVGFDQPIAVLEIIVNRLPKWIDRGHTVTLDAGYEGVHERVFTGYVKARGEEDPGFARSLYRVLGNGFTAVATLLGGGNLFKPPGPAGWHSEQEEQHPLADTQAKNDEMAQRGLARTARVPRRPAGDIQRRTIHCVSQLDKAERTIEMSARSFDLLTVKEAIENVCNYIGITNRQIDSEFTGFTLGTASVAQLSRMPAIQMFAYLVKLIGSSTSATAEGKVYDSDDGVTLFQVMDDIAPAATAFRTLSTETQAQAHIIDNTSHLIFPGDPRIKLGMTLGIVQPRLSLDGRFIVHNRKLSFGKGGFLSDCDMRGGDEVGGTVGLNPVASFAYRMTREVIGDRVYAVVSFTDQSYDSDGSIVQATSTWSDTHATVPEITTFNGRASGQVRIDAATTGYAITRTVIDNDGLTRALTQTIDLGATVNDNEQPALFVAQDVGAGASPDGGQTWNDQADATCKSVDAKPWDGAQSGIACYGMTNGRIEKTSDFCRSALTQVLAADAANGEINDIWWDKNVPTRVWACTSTGRLLRDNADGATFATVHKDFGNTYPLNRIATPITQQVGEPESVWVYGGRADVPATLIQYDRGLTGTFVSPTIAGELGTDLVGASSSATVAAAASSQFGELLIAIKGALLPGGVNLFCTNDIHGTGTAWKRATGLDASLSEWRWVSPSSRPGIFYGQTANVRHIWKIDCTTGTPVCTKLSDVLPNLAGITANHGLWEGEFIGGVTDVYLISVETTAKTEGIYKWVAEETAAGALRPATGFAVTPANFKGRMTAIGAPARGTSLSGRLAATTRSASPRTITKLLDTAVWDALLAMTGVTSNDPRPFWLTPNICMVTNGTGIPDYSKDGGASFAALPAALAGATSFCVAASGRIWVACDVGTTIEIYFSDDDGDTWDLSETITGPGSNAAPYQITAHPTNERIVSVSGECANPGRMGLNVTTQDAHLGTTATWTSTSGFGVPFAEQAGFAQQLLMKIFPNNRFIAALESGFNWDIWTSDNFGVTWVTRYTVDAGSNIRYWGPCIAPDGKAVVLRRDTTPTPDTIEFLRSLDFGQSWSLVSPTIPYTTFIGVATPIVSAFTYDPDLDVAYIAQTSAAAFAIVKYDFATDTWTDMKDAIGSTSFGTNNLSVIPRA